LAIGRNFVARQRGHFAPIHLEADDVFHHFHRQDVFRRAIGTVVLDDGCVLGSRNQIGGCFAVPLLD
jgi:hypothetical protein